MLLQTRTRTCSPLRRCHAVARASRSRVRPRGVFGLDDPVVDADDDRAGEAARAWNQNQRGELADADADADTDGGGAVVDAWVDTDTETDVDDDAGVGVLYGKATLIKQQ